MALDVRRSLPIAAAAGSVPLIETRNLTKLYQVRAGWITKRLSWLSAVEDVSLSVYRGETVGLVGESGSGKSTLARLLVRLIEPTRGEVRYDGHDISTLSGGGRRRFRRKAQIIFQDPYSSLNPRHTVETIIGEGIQGLGRRHKQRRLAELLDLVSLTPDALQRYPHEFSGGQRQRIGIARALAVDPEFLVLDEPVSALDVSVQSKILNLLRDLKDALNLTYVFISHDLSVVRHMADRVAVMYLGQLVELASRPEIFANPLHPYTQALLSAMPMVGGRVQSQGRIRLTGEIPSAIGIPKRCRFATRCFRPVERSWQEVPSMQEAADSHYVACFNYAPLSQLQQG